MKKNMLTMLLLTVATALMAQTPTATVNIWEGMTPPTDNGLTGDEQNHGLYISNVTQPTLTVYVPRRCTGKAVIACPGGAYGVVWTGTEGHNFASWFNSKGVTFAVLKYRMPNGHRTVPLEDFQRAITIMREHAEEWGGYSVVGVMGSSAGGHLASTAATHYTDAVTRPDFQILCYPVTSFQDGLVHTVTMDNLLGTEKTTEMRNYYSNEKQVTAETPRAFIVHAADDRTVTAKASTAYANALIDHGVPTTLQIYPTGDHGCTTNESWMYNNVYLNALANFLTNVPLKPVVSGEEVIYTFDEFENQYTVYSNKPGSITEADGALHTEADSEHKIIFESETPMDEFEVSCDISLAEPVVNAGLYVLATKPQNDPDKITAFNVQVERFNGASALTPRIFRFDSNSGYLGTLTSGSAYTPKGDTVNLKVICKNNTLYVYLDNSIDPVITYQLPETGLAGDVGLRSQYSKCTFDNFRIKSNQYVKKGTSDVNAVSISAANDSLYNLQGQRIQQPTANTVYIANGRKNVQH